MKSFPQSMYMQIGVCLNHHRIVYTSKYIVCID